MYNFNHICKALENAFLHSEMQLTNVSTFFNWIQFQIIFPILWQNLMTSLFASFEENWIKIIAPQS